MTKLSEFEREHAASILDAEPHLVPIPPERVTRVLCGIPIRKPPQIVKAVLETVAAQQCRAKVELQVLAVPNFSPGDPDKDATLALLKAAEAQGVIVTANQEAPPNDYGQKAETRAWTQPAFQRMANLKNGIIQYAMANRYDFLWLLDADVLCDPYTLQSMLDTAGHDQWLLNETLGLPIVSAVYWTRWQRPTPDSTDHVHAGPQVWLVHPYQQHGRGWEAADFRAALINRQRVQVWGLGACTLIDRKSLEHGLSFSPFEGLPPGPMSEGEDRHFCARATQLHIPMIADAWPDIYHAYHPEEYGEIDEQIKRFTIQVRGGPVLGGLVSGRVEALEPIPDTTGRLMRPRPQWIRGRLGQLPVVPQIEEALASMECGETRLVKVAFPAHYPQASLRNRNVVLRITLFDCKPFRIAPVVEHEVFVGHGTGAILDHTTMTAHQIEEMVHD